MTNTRFLGGRFVLETTTSWVEGCAAKAGWSADEANRLATCVTESARAVSERAYHVNTSGPVYVKLDLDADAAMLELHHEGSVGDKPCDCAAAKVAVERISTNWTDAQLRTHRMRIERA